MKYRFMFNLLAVALFLALAPAALASTWYVDGVNGNDNNDCKTPQTACKTIGHAISLASSGDTIKVAPATYTENLTIGVSLKILGANASTTIVDGGGVNTVITALPAHVILSKLTIRNGYATTYGGGIINFGTLTIHHSVLTANSAYYGGAGIENYGTLTINNSAITANSLSYRYGGGGGILNWGALTINKSTISGNSGSDGAGIYTGCCSDYAPQATTINNSTISENSANYAGGIEIDVGTGTINNSTISGNVGGIWNGGASVILQNSIVANNSGGNCGGTMTSNGYNLSDDNTCNFNGPGDMNNTPAKLGKLGCHGGPTKTIPLLEGSPAIDAGNPNGCTDGNGNLLKTDQRGKPRPDKEDNGIGCDMGAYEKQSD